MSRVGRSDEGSTQEFMDNIHKHERPRSVETDFGPFDVPPEGFPCSYPVSFGYAIKYGVCKSSDYPWTGVPKSSTYSGATWDGKVVAGTRTVPIDRVCSSEPLHFAVFFNILIFLFLFSVFRRQRSPLNAVKNLKAMEKLKVTWKNNQWLHALC